MPVWEFERRRCCWGHRFNLRATGNPPNSARAAAIAAGPLGVFLDAAVRTRRNDPDLPPLHLLNLRDWHVPGSTYDAERRLYSTHCEEQTWGAEYHERVEQASEPKAWGRLTGKLTGRVCICADALAWCVPPFWAPTRNAARMAEYDTCPRCEKDWFNPCLPPWPES